MSKATATATARATARATATPYCSVCHSAGKSKAEYSSHYLRESKAADAKTTCPYLLEITCGYCKGKGHTPKYCPVSKQKQAQQQTQKQAQQQTQAQQQAPATPPPSIRAAQVPNAPKKAARNKFALLQDVMDEEERIAEQAIKAAEQAAEQAVQDQQKMREHQTAFPLITNETKTKSMSGHLTGWSAIAAKPKQAQPKQAQAQQTQAQQAQPKQAQPKQTQAQQAQAQQTQEIDAPFDDMNPEMTKHFRKTIAAMFKDKEVETEDKEVETEDKEVETEEDKVEEDKVEEDKVETEGNKYSCGFSWAD